MPEITLVQIGSIGGALLVGVLLGWLFRNSRSRLEKKAINAGWQAQIDAQQSEHDRLAGQNKSLMEQISQYQASNKDSKMRARELSDSLKEAFSRRDDLQRQLKDIRSNLEIAVTQRDKFESDINISSVRGAETSQTLIEKDERIGKLTQELKNWQDRVPPLVERYRQRDLEAQQLELELQKANEHIATLDSMSQGEHTRIEPVDSRSLPDGMDASNEPHSSTAIHANAAPEDDRLTHDDADSASEAVPEIDEPEVESELEPELESSKADTDTTDSDQRAAAPTGNGTDNVFPNLIDDQFATGLQEQDNLKEIKGVGPAIEKTLNGLGIYRFNQIAEMSEYDIDRVAQQLKGFRSRIYREDWIGQARTLQYQKNNEG
jgi:predicted flap endonuclease-1-like 5' DNA nuclease